MSLIITATTNTLFKKKTAQGSELENSEIVSIKAGDTWKIKSFAEQEDETGESEIKIFNGHAEVELEYDAGTWFIFLEHWNLPWQTIIETPPKKLPTWNEVNWDDWESPVSKYFTVGEVCLFQSQRKPARDINPFTGQVYSAEMVKRNVVTIARFADEIREEWGPIGVNSFLRPWNINRKVGSRSDNHPLGTAMDIRCLRGNTLGLERMIEKKFYQGKQANIGFGRGAARRGFVHIDQNSRLGRRVWNY